MESVVCGRCNGKGHLKCYSHVKAGVCFQCWGTGDDLRKQWSQLIDSLQALRKQWVQTKRAGAPVETLEAIAQRGKRVAAMVQRHELLVQTLAAQHR